MNEDNRRRDREAREWAADICADRHERAQRRLATYMKVNEDVHRNAEVSRRYLAVASGLNLALIVYALWLTGGLMQ